MFAVKSTCSSIFAKHSIYRSVCRFSFMYNRIDALFWDCTNQPVSTNMFDPSQYTQHLLLKKHKKSSDIPRHLIHHIPTFATPYTLHTFICKIQQAQTHYHTLTNQKHPPPIHTHTHAQIYTLCKLQVSVQVYNTQFIHSQSQAVAESPSHPAVPDE